MGVPVGRTPRPAAPLLAVGRVVGVPPPAQARPVANARLRRSTGTHLRVVQNAARPRPDNLSPEQLRHHVDLLSTIPLTSVSRVSEDEYGTEIRGHTNAGADAIHRAIASAGYTQIGEQRGTNVDPRYPERVYEHPEGHELIIEKHGHADPNGPRRRVVYHPAPAAYEHNEMSHAANVASFHAHAAHRKLGVSEDYVPDPVQFPQYREVFEARKATRDAAAQAHADAAFAHGAAMDKAVDDSRHADAARHERLAAHHRAAARHLNPEQFTGNGRGR